MKTNRLILAIVIATAIAAFFYFDLGRYLTLSYIHRQGDVINTWVASNPWKAGTGYFIIYVLMAALSLPGAALMTLAGGLLFGLWWGTLLVSFASSLGALLAFSAARFLFQEIVQKRFRRQLLSVNENIDREGAFYLFTLRLIPIFPFFVINLVMGLTRIPAFRFYWISQLGMLPGTLVYVNAGQQLSQLESLRGILSPGILFSFALLGFFPLLAKRTIEIIKHRRTLRGYKVPGCFDYNLIVIGAGSAGLVASYIAAAIKAKVALVEKHKMGGDCLNTGCVPSKALIRSARFAFDANRARQLGFRDVHLDYNFADVMERVQRIVKRVEPHDSVERYTKLGVDCLQGSARITSPWSVEVDGKTHTARAIVIATGARPFVPSIDGLEQVNYLTSDSVWEIRELPKRLVVLGGGPIGCELAQAFSRLGSRVTQVEMAPRILSREDEDVSAFISEIFNTEGIEVRVNHTARAVQKTNGNNQLICDHSGGKVEIEFDQLLVAIGRKADTEGLGLESLGIRLRPGGTIETDTFLRTAVPTIYASGDVTGPYQFTHSAAHQSWYAAVNALFGFIWKFRVDYSVIPWTTFVDPEVARVGLNEEDARRQEIDYEVVKYDLEELDRAITEEAGHGFVKVLTVPGRDTILGVTIVGEHSGDLLAEYVLAMKRGIGLNKILGTIHTYPTMAEANKYAAGIWKQAHAPQGLLRWVERLHHLRR